MGIHADFDATDAGILIGTRALCHWSVASICADSPQADADCLDEDAANQAHLAAKDVPALRQLIEAGSAQEPAEAG